LTSCFDVTESRAEPRETPMTIIAPMMRHLGVADAARSLAFYRDVLGFDVRVVRAENGVPAVVDVASGPARIRLATSGGVAANEGQRRVLFLQTDDVAAMHAAVRARGGEPTELEDVNWIKMRMFEIRDPDGHTLWLGQSFDEPEPQTASHSTRRMLRSIMPELPLGDVPAGVAHYRDVLGFHVNYAQHDLGVMDRDRVRLLLIARTERHTGIGSCYVYVDDADALHAELRATGANVLDEPVSQPWGLREFRVLDLEGNRITFGQPFE
jgi:predicted enzyme related to lactoylglutathione lyase